MSAFEDGFQSDGGNDAPAYKPLCPDAWAIPPSPRMVSFGNDYYSCSKCGEPCERPDSNKVDTPAPDQAAERREAYKFADNPLAHNLLMTYKGLVRRRGIDHALADIAEGNAKAMEAYA